ncbi:hypothetical protein JYU34_019388 [Plutella xylostella]|uniref:Uncharacterized protein n=1 Tax=Plutella xylostella TaxID=51655 RepID=A0ABQ7PWY4_PLUXY|nr:hypothetical protein JYU34_019388 [Plutella xylostella]
MHTLTVASIVIGLTCVVLLVLLRWKLRRRACNIGKKASCKSLAPACSPDPVRLVHRLCPHNNVLQSIEVEEKDSLDEHLDVLAKKLAEKEGRLRISKYKIHQTQCEIENLQAIDQNVRSKYQEIMGSLRCDLVSNEQECHRLQEQIEWVTRRRAQIRQEVNRGKEMYNKAAAELATNLAEYQRGRADQPTSWCAQRRRQPPSCSERRPSCHPVTPSCGHKVLEPRIAPFCARHED